jgi:hypothetical protein
MDWTLASGKWREKVEYSALLETNIVGCSFSMKVPRLKCTARTHRSDRMNSQKMRGATYLQLLEAFQGVDG